MKSLKHPNICAFIGALKENQEISILTEFSNRGSLDEILETDNIILDEMFISSILSDLIKVN